MSDEPEFDGEEEEFEDEELDEGLTGEETVEITIDNVHGLYEALHQESPMFPPQFIYQFLVTREMMDHEITLKEFAEKFNKFVEEKVNDTLLEMAKDGELEMSLEGDDFTFQVPEGTDSIFQIPPDSKIKGKKKRKKK